MSRPDVFFASLSCVQKHLCCGLLCECADVQCLRVQTLYAAADDRLELRDFSWCCCDCWQQATLQVEAAAALYVATAFLLAEVGDSNTLGLLAALCDYIAIKYGSRMRR